MKAASWVATALFVFSAIVQWNDPDPLRWILIYLAAASLSGAFSLGMAVRWPALLAAPVLTGLAIAAAPSTLPDSMSDLLAPKMKTLVIEETRESLGLALCAGWCVVIGLQSPTRRLEREESES